MFETENQSVGSSESLTESVAAGNETQSEGASQQAAATTQESQTVKDTPFHEHPRFKELVEQKNQFAKQTQDYQRQLAQVQAQIRDMQSQSISKQKQEDALHARLKGIDPEFGERFAKVDSSLNELQELKQWKQQMELNQIRERGIQTVTSLHNEHKVTGDMQEFYNSQIEAAIRMNPQATLEDIPGIYKQVHDKFSKLFESRDRAQRESYVQTKQKDANIPSSSKGKASTSTKAGFEYSKEPQEARKQLIGNILKHARAGQE